MTSPSSHIESENPMSKGGVDAACRHGPRSPGLFPVATVLVLFFVSGASSLSFETLWVRQLRGVLGSSVHAVSTVLAVFMAGLALGSAAAARIPRRYHPLQVYALLQCGIAFSGLASVLLLAQTGPTCACLYREFGGRAWVLDVARYALSLGVLLVPALLMGGTLPVLSRFIGGHRSALGLRMGLLYGLNTLGAALGCAVTGFYLLGAVGVKATAHLAMTAAVMTGLLAWMLSRRVVHAPVHDRKAAEETPVDAGIAAEESTVGALPSRRLVLLVYAVAGFCGLAYEVLWTRALVFFVGNTVYAFTAVLTTLLGGIALGSVLAAPAIARSRHVTALFGVIEALIGCWALLLLYAAGLWGEELVGFAEHFPRWQSTAAGLFRGALVVLVPTTLMGAAFPVACCLYRRGKADIARDIGTLYACNTMGAILGSAVTGFLLMPALGVELSMALVAAVNLSIGALLWWRDGTLTVRTRRFGTVLIAALSVVALTGRPRQVVRRLHDLAWSTARVVFFREDPAGTVAVIEAQGERTILVDNIDVAGTSSIYTDSSTSLAHIPLLLHPQPSRVFVLGFGAGGTTSSICTHPEVRRVEAAELCGSVAELAPQFAEVNRDVLKDNRVALSVADGREFLLTSRNSYDVISVDLLLAASAGSGSLYTQDFYRLCRERLNEGGIVAQWIAPGHIPLNVLKTILRTAQSVFPYTALWFSGQCKHLVLVGAQHTPRIDLNAIARRLENQRVRADLARVGLADSCDLFARLIAGGRNLRQFAGPGPINTDDLPLVEFVLPSADLSLSRLQNLVALRTGWLSTWQRPALVPAEWQAPLADALERQRHNLSQAMAQEYVVGGQTLANEGHFQEATLFWKQAIELAPSNPAGHHHLALAYYRQGQPDRAIAGLRHVLQLEPTHAQALNNLGGILRSQGNAAEAVELLRLASQLLPENPEPRTNLAGALAQAGRIDEAVREYEAVLHSFPGYAPALEAVAKARAARVAGPSPPAAPDSAREQGEPE